MPTLFEPVLKLVSLETLAGFRGVLCHGCFDVLHPGHLEQLQQAAKLGRLVVSVTADAFVDKGPGRPVFPEYDRASMLAALECVCAVVINHAFDATPVINVVRPRFYVKGEEYRGVDDDPRLNRERMSVENHGGQIIFLGRKGYSSTAIVEGRLLASRIKPRGVGEGEIGIE